MGGIKCTCHIKGSAFEFGVNCRRKGISIKHAPYPVESKEWHDFRNGWHEADKTTDDCENGRGLDGQE